MNRYREVYNQLVDSQPTGLFDSGKPTVTDDLLRAAGLDVQGHDSRVASMEAVTIVLVERLKSLEARLQKLKGEEE